MLDVREYYLRILNISLSKESQLSFNLIPNNRILVLFQEQWSEAHQERLDFQRARVMEINRHLSALQFSWERGGFPSHMNLAVHHRPTQHSLKQTNDALNQLKT